MPKSKGNSKYGVTVPSTLQRSSAKAQRTYAKAKASAEKTYGAGERAGRTAISALKHSFEKVGDHWEAKKRKGPSDEQARKSVSKRSDGSRRVPQGKTAGGVDVNGHSKDELYQRARSLDISGISRMNKRELADAIARHQ